MKTILITLVLSSSICMAAPAASPAEGPGAGPVASPKEADVQPSRFLADGADDRILKMRQRLAINKRERGPFGLYQVPGKTPIFSGPMPKKSRKTPFNEFINQIEISVINAKEKEFLVGARMFRLGQVFPIVRGGERLSVRIESVKPSQVTFKNLQTGEIAQRRLDVLPDGISATAGNIEVRGVTPNNRGEAAPLHLDFDSPPTP